MEFQGQLTCPNTNINQILGIIQWQFQLQVIWLRSPGMKLSENEPWEIRKLCWQFICKITKRIHGNLEICSLQYILYRNTSNVCRSLKACMYKCPIMIYTYVGSWWIVEKKECSSFLCGASLTDRKRLHSRSSSSIRATLTADLHYWSLVQSEAGLHNLPLTIRFRLTLLQQHVDVANKWPACTAADLRPK